MDSCVPCPHCGASQGRLLTDHLGSVGWCRDCHRTWLTPAPRRQGQSRQDGDTPRERRIA